MLFLPIVFLLYWLTTRSARSQNALLLLVSYIFYGWWDWRFLGLLSGLTLTSWACALPRTRRRMWAGVNVAVCIAALIAFKYAGFFAENLRWLFENFGWEMDWFTVEVLLPVGLSFYALQAISYSVDVAGGRLEPERNLVTMALYISFFPQLVAGPIEQATSLLPQLKAPRAFDYGQAVEGMRRIVWGFFKKVVVADGVAVWVDHVYNFYNLYDGVTVPFYFAGAAMLFAIQIYADFSGYSDIAIGSAQLLGIRLTDNFLFPFFSRNGRELWSRWHRSLYIWLRTYVYIPLGGKKKHRLLNMAIVWALTGMWHGASWNFVLWGLYFFVILTIEKQVGEKSMRRVPYLLRRLGTMLLIIFGWNIFYYTDMTRLVQNFGVMFGLYGAGFSNAQAGIQLTNNLPLLLLCAIGATSIPRNLGSLFGGVCAQGGKKSGQIVYAAVSFVFDAALLALSTIALVGSTYNAFLYFRF